MPDLSRFIVCGSRDGCGVGVVERALTAFDRDTLRLEHVIVGSHRGVDGDAANWALRHERIITIVPAEWNRFGKAAGPTRNERMPQLFQVRGVLAFPGGAGTAGMVSIARREHIPLWHCLISGHHWQWRRELEEVANG